MHNVNKDTITEYLSHMRTNGQCNVFKLDPNFTGVFGCDQLVFQPFIGSWYLIHIHDCVDS